MKQYFVIEGEFANTYTVWSAESKQTIDELISRGARKITKKDADRLCREERDRRAYGGNGGFASAAIRDAEYEL